MASRAIHSPKATRAKSIVATNPNAAIAEKFMGWSESGVAVEDLAVGQIRFENGAILSIEAMFTPGMRGSALA